MKIDDFVARADQLIRQADEVLKTRSHFNDAYWQEHNVDSAASSSYRAACLSFLTQAFGEAHSYTKELARVFQGSGRQDVREAQALLRAAREELAGGWFVALRSLVSAEVFADFLEMAEYLISEGYHHAGAVISGSVLEEHLRQLCAKVGIPVETLDSSGKVTPRKADLLNSELAKAGAYNKLDQKSVTSWLDLRNKAAHGKYSEYTPEQVANMHRSVTEFVSRVRP